MSYLSFNISNTMPLDVTLPLPVHLPVHLHVPLPVVPLPVVPLPQNINTASLMGFESSAPSTPRASTTQTAPSSPSSSSSRFHRTAQSDILTAAIKILTDGIIEERKHNHYVHISNLFENELDLAIWLNKMNKNERYSKYSEWLITRRPNSERIRNSIVIRHLNEYTTNADVFIICSRIGTVLDIYKPKDDKGFVFVDFEDSLSIGLAIRELHKVKLHQVSHLYSSFL